MVKTFDHRRIVSGRRLQRALLTRPAGAPSSWIRTGGQRPQPIGLRDGRVSDESISAQQNLKSSTGALRLWW
jgi:hypothetical protein